MDEKKGKQRKYTGHIKDIKRAKKENM